MTEHIHQSNIHLTWQAILWRLVLTGFLLVALASSSFALFDTVAEHSDTPVLPILSQDTDSTLAR